jgi:transcription factor IIIB subunit 2
MQCGFIMTQNAIVSEVGFVEGANGASSVLGQFVPSTGAARLSASAKTRGPGGRGPSVGYQKDSREHTIQNGRKHIQQVADHLRLRVHHVDSAVRLFMLAVQHNFIQGQY